jgi:hypothetical protein
VSTYFETINKTRSFHLIDFDPSVQILLITIFHTQSRSICLKGILAIRCGSQIIRITPRSPQKGNPVISNVPCQCSVAFCGSLSLSWYDPFHFNCCLEPLRLSHLYPGMRAFSSISWFVVQATSLVICRLWALYMWRIQLVLAEDSEGLRYGGGMI